MRPRRHQVGHGLAGVAGGDQPLPHEHGVGAGPGVGDQVVRAATERTDEQRAQSAWTALDRGLDPTTDPPEGPTDRPS